MEQDSNNQVAVLIVEDDRLTADLVTNMLAQEGYGIQTASDGAQCLDMLNESTPNLILMDVGLPVMNGIETCKQVRSNPESTKIPIIFVTANTDDDTLEAAFNAGGNDYVCKPVNRIELLARVRSALTQQMAIEQLAEEEKLKAVLETAGGVCHKLNQPLQFVLGSLQILMMDMEPDEPKHKELAAILERVETMGEITRKLADITRYRTREHAGGQNILDIDQCLKKT